MGKGNEQRITEGQARALGWFQYGERWTHRERPFIRLTWGELHEALVGEVEDIEAELRAQAAYEGAPERRAEAELLDRYGYRCDPVTGWHYHPHVVAPVGRQVALVKARSDELLERTGFQREGDGYIDTKDGRRVDRFEALRIAHQRADEVA